MNLNNFKTKIKSGLAAVTVTVLSAPVLADGLLDGAKTELETIKSGIADFGLVIIGIGVGIASIGVIKRLVNKA